MQSVQAVLLSLAVLAFSGEAVTMKKMNVENAAIAKLLRSSGPELQTKEIVSSLEEVGKSLEAEDQAALTMIKETAKACKKKENDFKMSMAKNRRAIDISSEDLKKSNAQIDAMKASAGELQRQITDSNSELDSLQTQLKKMRKDKGLLKAGAASALQQVEQVAAKVHLLGKHHDHDTVTQLREQVTSLEHLSETLSFLEVAAEKKEVKSPTLMLRADKMEVIKASEATQRGFNEEEAKLLDLIRKERKKLGDLEDNLADLRPSISNKLQQAMEIEQTLEAAKRATASDESLAKVWEDKCTLIDEHLGAQRKVRADAKSDVLMAAKLVGRMDTALFLAQDVQQLKRRAISLLEVPGFDSKDYDDDEASTANAAQVSKIMMTLAQQVSKTSSEESAEASLSSTESGPFDKVMEMISGLIASMKAQAAEEVNQHQFCQDGMSENRRHRVQKKLNLDILTSDIRWGKMALTRLNDDQKYCENEITRMGEFKDENKKAEDKEEKRVKKELAEHKVADEVVQKVIIILKQLCNLGGSASLFQGRNSNHKQGSKYDQCEEAVELLNSGRSTIAKLNTITNKYLAGANELNDQTVALFTETIQDRTNQLTDVKAHKAQRASELANNQKDLRENKKELDLIDKAKKELEHQCTHTETREEKMARRAEEISALKEALKVIEGDAVPV